MSGLDVFEVLGHNIRREILKIIYDRIEVSYTEILNTLSISDGLLNFHLRRMGDLLIKTEKGTYILSDKGKKVYELMVLLEKVQGAPIKSGAPSISKNIVFRRIAAFLIDILIFFIFTGLFLDPILWNYIIEIFTHIGELIRLHPWIFHPEHLPMISQLVFRIISYYSHIFFAIYIFVTLLEAYKGQTPGKYIMGIRVVKVGGLRVGIVESGIRNAGKVFLLPLDILIGIIFYRRRGFIRFFDYYTDVYVERVVRG